MNICNRHNSRMNLRDVSKVHECLVCFFYDVVSNVVIIIYLRNDNNIKSKLNLKTVNIILIAINKEE